MTLSLSVIIYLSQYWHVLDVSEDIDWRMEGHVGFECFYLAGTTFNCRQRDRQTDRQINRQTDKKSQKHIRALLVNLFLSFYQPRSMVWIETIFSYFFICQSTLFMHSFLFQIICDIVLLNKAFVFFCFLKNHFSYVLPSWRSIWSPKQQP